MSVGAPFKDDDLLDELKNSGDSSKQLKVKCAGEHPVHYLYNQNFLKTLSYLVRQNVPLDLNHTNAIGEGIVHQVAQRGEFDWLSWLSKQDVELFQETHTGRNIYHYTAHLRDPLFLDILFSLTKNKDIVFLQDQSHKWPLTLAIEFDNEEYFKYLLTHFKKETLGFRDALNQNCLHYIARHNATKCYTFLRTFLTKEELESLEDTVNVDLQTPLMLAQQLMNVDARSNIYELMMNYIDDDYRLSLQWMTSLAISDPTKVLEKKNDSLSYCPHFAQIADDARLKRKGKELAEFEAGIEHDQSDDVYPYAPVKYI